MCNYFGNFGLILNLSENNTNPSQRQNHVLEYVHKRDLHAHNNDFYLNLQYYGTQLKHDHTFSHNGNFIRPQKVQGTY